MIVSIVSKTSLYALSTAFVDKARIIHMNMFSSEKLCVTIIYISVLHHVMHNWHEKGLGNLNLPILTCLLIISSISNGNPE